MARTTYNRAKSNLNVKDATRVARSMWSSQKLRGDMREAIETYATPILEELEIFDALRESDSVSFAQRCLIFAICSPQCRFDVNVRAAVRFGDKLYRKFESVDDVYQTLTHNGRDSWVTAGMVARNLYHSLDFLRNISDDDMDKRTILALRKAGKVKGLGMKTASMALALYDSENEVYTLDVHMLRGLLGAVGEPDLIGASMTITDAAYPIIERTFVDLHAEICPELPIFVSQWALWNLWGFGTHMRHREIFN